MKKAKDFGFNVALPLAETVLDLVSKADVKLVIEILLKQYYPRVDNMFLRMEIEEFLSNIYAGRYLVKCEHSASFLGVGSLYDRVIKIRFVGIDEDFTVTLELDPVANDQADLFAS